MLPGSSGERIRRDSYQGGRAHEISRLIGRSLRAVVRLDAIPETMVRVDCDVLQADGGTRTAAITGAWVALHDTFTAAVERGSITEVPLIDQVAAVSVGIVDGRAHARPGVRGRCRCRGRHERGDDRSGPAGRGPGDGGGPALPPQRVGRDARPRPRAGSRRSASCSVKPSPRDRPAGRRHARTRTSSPRSRRSWSTRGWWRSWPAVCSWPEIEETEPTLEGNARLKARTVSELTGLPALGDDTGLEVTALDGAPGVRTARFSGPGATYASNRAAPALRPRRRDGPIEPCSAR